MGAAKQQTLKAPVEFSGVGLHTGEDCKVVVRPAVDGAGIVFKRSDLAERNNAIIVAPENVIFAHHGTVLGNTAGISVATVEHLMAALAICAVDNAAIEVYGPEIPILDGSSRDFVEAFKTVGITPQSLYRNPIIIDEAVIIEDGPRSIKAEPYDGFALDVIIDFGDCFIGRQQFSMCFDTALDVDRLARSRTFCRLYEVECLRREGLIRGGSLENSWVIDGDKVLNPEPLSDPEEFVLHKSLDLIGDLYLLGRPIKGRIIAERPGHDLNAKLAIALAERYAAAPSSPASLALAAMA